MNKEEYEIKKEIEKRLKCSNKSLWNSLSKEKQDFVVNKYYDANSIENVGILKVLEDNRGLRMNLISIFIGLSLGLFGNAAYDVVLKYLPNGVFDAPILMGFVVILFLSIREINKIAAEHLGNNKVLEYLLKSSPIILYKNMKILKIIKDSDIGSTFMEPENFRERKAARAVVFDENNKVALVYSTKNNYHKLPGGGVEEGEDFEIAVQRELIEEIGCTVENIKELGMVEEYRNKVGLHQTSYCYTARVIEKGTPELEANEIMEGYVTQWLALDEAIEILEKEKNVDHYDGKFMWLRDITFLKEVK
ncbi:NUDIX domain-containing protein [Candidatus Gracilibacteria bacterium]|nr:NUDIX domain-containing protein [Candidatus Gracilibacteria bacterium]